MLEREVAPAADGKPLIIACPITPRLSNFDDLDPLALAEGVEVRMIRPGTRLPAEADLVVLAGSKATIADLEFLRREGWDIDIYAHVRRGGRVLGICGGYQMLGRTIADPNGVEGPAGDVKGLGLLAVDTVLSGSKALCAVEGKALGAALDGYEMHIGTTTGPDTLRSLARLDDGRPDGAMSANGRIMGTYVHGLFNKAAQRDAWLRLLGGGLAAGGMDHTAVVDQALDAIAAQLEQHVDVEALIALSQRAGKYQNQ